MIGTENNWCQVGERESLFHLFYHLIYLGGKRDQKKKKNQLQMNIVFHLFAKLYVDTGIENISKVRAVFTHKINVNHRLEPL